MALGQYLKETQAELRHVAWPTRTQTIVYTVLVAALSVGVSLYLGFFDFLFTTGLTRFLEIFPPVTPITTEQPASTTLATTSSNLQLTTQPATTTKKK